MPKPLWTPTQEQVAQANMTAFMETVRSQWGFDAESYSYLYDWSIKNPETFWQAIWDFCGVIGDKGKKAFQPASEMFKSRFFPEARLNFAENLLRPRDDETVIIFRGEDRVKRSMTFKSLFEQVSQCAAALKELGVQKGDRVAGYLPNMPETIVAMLATTSLGAILLRPANSLH